MLRVRCHFEQASIAEGASLSPPISELDVIHVLTNWAARRQDETHPWRWYATGPRPEDGPLITVVYVNGKDEIVAVAAYPATEREVQAYQRLSMEEHLCIPADDMGSC